VNLINLIITFLPLVVIVIFLGMMFKGKFFGPRTYSQMMDENIQRLKRIEGHLERMATSTEQIATELKTLVNRLAGSGTVNV
jgi:uncharacterized protein YoxC